MAQAVEAMAGGLADTHRTGHHRGRRAARLQHDESDRIAATTAKRQMHYSGGTFTFGVDAMGSLADKISALVANNSPLLNTSSRTVQGEAPKLYRSGGGGNGGGGGRPIRMSDEERSLVGFFGEAIAFEWLKHKFSAKRIVDENCWKSTYCMHVSGKPGDDGLGYDFELMNGGTRWLFEVKSTAAPGPATIQSIELGSTEFLCADASKTDCWSSLALPIFLSGWTIWRVGASPQLLTGSYSVPLQGSDEISEP